MMFILHETETYRAEYDTTGPYLLLTEITTGRTRSMQGEEAAEFDEFVDNLPEEDADDFFNSEVSNHFLEDNEDDYERGLI